MTAKTHTVGGYVAGAGTLLLLNNAGLTVEQGHIMELITTTLALYTAATSAVLPDVDDVRSRAGRKLLIISVPFMLFRIAGKITGSQWFKHRGLTHYLVTWLTVSAVITIPCITGLTSGGLLIRTITKALFFFPIGYLSHILLDLLSGKIKLLYPIFKKSIGICLFPRNSIRELLLCGVLFITAIYLTTKIISIT